MSDQNFHKEVGNVAAGNIYQYYQHPPDGSSPLGPQKWVAKDYWFGTRITSGWLVLLLSLSFLLFLAIGGTILLMAVRRIFAHEHIGLGPLSIMPPGLILGLIGWATGIAWRVHLREFTYLEGTLSAFAKDGNGHVFRGKLGGEGIICPICKAQLRFCSVGFQTGLRRTPNSAHEWPFDSTMDLEIYPVLRCRRNSAHEWPFDFTLIQD